MNDRYEEQRRKDDEARRKQGKTPTHALSTARSPNPQFRIALSGGFS